MKNKSVEANLRFENGKPYIEVICNGYVSKNFVTLEQVSKILLQWVASVKKQPILMVINYEEEK